jgi:hypothetical protein
MLVSEVTVWVELCAVQIDSSFSRVKRHGAGALLCREIVTCLEECELF